MSFFKLPAVLGLVSLVLTGPALEADEFFPREFNREILIAPEKKDESPRINFSLVLLETKGPADLVRFFNGFLYSGKSPAAYRDDLVAEYLKSMKEADADMAEYAKMMKEMNEDMGGFPSQRQKWEYSETIEIWNPQGKAAVIARETYDYSGGAHGNSAKKYYVVDTEARRILSLEDFFRDPQSGALRTMILEELRLYSARQDTPIPQGRPLSAGIFLEDNPEMSPNFFVTQDGLGLHWDPYEIAPYAEGSIEITLPWRKIRPLMKTGGMELLVKFGIYLFV
jgi:hypothetical protein